MRNFKKYPRHKVDEGLVVDEWREWACPAQFCSVFIAGKISMRWQWPVGGQLEVWTEQQCSPKGVNSSQAASTPSPTLFPTAVKKHWPKTTLEKAGLFDLYILDHSSLKSMPGTQGKNPEAGTKGRFHGGTELPDLFLLAYSAYFLIQPTWPGMGHCPQCPALFLTNHQALVTNQKMFS